MYYSNAIDSEILDRILKNLTNIRIDYPEIEGFALTGYSGVCLASLIKFQFPSRGVVLVRKPDDSTHACESVEGNTECKKLMFIDDCIETGATFNRVREYLKEIDAEVTHIGLFQAGFPTHITKGPVETYEGLPVFSL